jgi:hypothetical protein
MVYRATVIPEQKLVHWQSIMMATYLNLYYYLGVILINWDGLRSAIKTIYGYRLALFTQYFCGTIGQSVEMTWGEMAQHQKIPLCL